MKVMSFSIFKGGTGKTTSAVNTAAALVEKGQRVLLIDLDQQASATRYLDLDPEQSPNLYAEFITPLKPTYDFILIDSPPGKAMLAFNALTAADLIVITASAERMAVDGVADLINYVQRIMWNKFGLSHQELRILFTMYRSTTSHSPAIVANAKKIWRDNVLSVKIPHSTIFSRSYDEKTPINMLSPKHQGAIAYGVFSDWLIDYEKTTH
jgi:chromosome partitioning protein